jgi:predicted dehydrogenase
MVNPSPPPGSGRWLSAAERRIRVALVGCGVIGEVYRNAIAALDAYRFVGACDTDPGKARAPAARGAPFFQRLDRLIEEVRPEAVVVTAPNDRHADVCAEALAAGVAVCCEKPLALAPSDAANLQAEAHRRGLTLLTAFHRRYNRNFLPLAPALAGATIRHLEVVYLERIEAHCGRDSWYLQPDRVGGGCIADNGPNALDTAMALLGPLTAIDCEVGRCQGDRDLLATIHLRAASGATVTCRLDWAYPHGEAKGVVAHLEDGRSLRADFLAGFPRFKSSLDHEYVAILEAFAVALRPPVRPEPSPAGDGLYPPDGAAVARLVAECYRLARPGLRSAFMEVGR